MLAIEIDGSSHDTDDAQEKDEHRQTELEALGVRFLRFRDEFVKTDPNSVAGKIEKWMMKAQITQNFQPY